MTFDKAALAIDGALTKSALVRTMAFAGASGQEGVVQSADLKVSPLSPVGAGVQIASGAALVLNRYQGAKPNQTYVVTNPDVHTISGADMPSAQPVATNYIVAVTVGDPEFSQAGHPWMPTTIPAGTEATFQYVRPIVMTEAAFNGRTFPALALARLRMRANDATILAGDIDDLRVLPRPRRSNEIGSVDATVATLNGGGGTPGTYQRFPDVGVVTVDIPSWAVRAKIMGFVSGLKLASGTPGAASLRAYVEGTALAGKITPINEISIPNADRRGYNFSGSIDVSSVAGTTKTFSVQATPATTAAKGMLSSDASTVVAMQIQFEEQAI